MAPPSPMLGMILLGLAGHAAAAMSAGSATCMPYNPVSYSAKQHLYTVDPFTYPGILPGNPFPPCTLTPLGYETKNVDAPANPIMNAKCNDRIKFVMRRISNLAKVAPAKGEDHGIYVLHNVKDESKPCPRAAECGTKAKNSVPCAKLGWGEEVLGMQEIDNTMVKTSKTLGSYVGYNSKSKATSTTLFFGCPEYIDFGLARIPTFTHCMIGMYIKVVVKHPPGGCK